MDHLSGTESLRNQFLIAMPGLSDGFFAHSVTYICEHNPQGAMGIVINHPTEMNLHDLFEHLSIDRGSCSGALPVMAGGPVQIDRGFILHDGAQRWKSTMLVSDDIALTTSIDIIDALANDNGPDHCLVALGYAGWGAGQLEDEMVNNAWLTVPADAGIIFDVPFGERASVAAAKLGIDLTLMSSQAGHA